MWKNNMKTEVVYRFFGTRCSMSVFMLRKVNVFIFIFCVRAVVIAFIHAHLKPKKKTRDSIANSRYFFATSYRFFFYFYRRCSLFFATHIWKKSPSNNIFYNENSVVNIFILIYKTFMTLAKVKPTRTRTLPTWQPHNHKPSILVLILIFMLNSPQSYHKPSTRYHRLSRPPFTC